MNLKMLKIAPEVLKSRFGIWIFSDHQLRKVQFRGTGPGCFKQKV